MIIEYDTEMLMPIIDHSSAAFLPAEGKSVRCLIHPIEDMTAWIGVELTPLFGFYYPNELPVVTNAKRLHLP